MCLLWNVIDFAKLLTKEMSPYFALEPTTLLCQLSHGVRGYFLSLRSQSWRYPNLESWGHYAVPFLLPVHATSNLNHPCTCASQRAFPTASYLALSHGIRRKNLSTPWGCEGLRGQAIGPGPPDGWRAEMRSQCPAFSPSTFPNTPPLLQEVSLGRVWSRKFYQIGINATNSYLKYLLWARHWGQRWDNIYSLPPASSESSGEDRPILGSCQYEVFEAML